MLLSFLISVVSLLLPSFALYFILFAASFLRLFPFFFFFVVICSVLLHSVLFFRSFLPAWFACSHPSFLPFLFLSSVHLVLISYLPFWCSSNRCFFIFLFVSFWVFALLPSFFSFLCFFCPSYSLPFFSILYLVFFCLWLACLLPFFSFLQLSRSYSVSC